MWPRLYSLLHGTLFFFSPLDHPQKKRRVNHEMKNYVWTFWNSTRRFRNSFSLSNALFRVLLLAPLPICLEVPDSTRWLSSVPVLIIFLSLLLWFYSRDKSGEATGCSEVCIRYGRLGILDYHLYSLERYTSFRKQVAGYLFHDLGDSATTLVQCSK